MSVYRDRQLATFQRLCDAFDHLDLDAWVSVYTEDVWYEDYALHWDLHSRDELRDQMGPWFAGCSTISASVLDSLHTPERAAIMYRFVCTLHNGQRTDAAGTSFMNFTPAGQISHEIAVWNMADMPNLAAADLGLNPDVGYQAAVKAAANGRGTSAARLAASYRARRGGMA